ncbi:MAG: formylglycine-generating enzyme family protein [Rhodospirillaceae bacterium]|nr:formylglycine-generating enzyme family protein [Rhodospirillaceae bacterium]
MGIRRNALGFVGLGFILFIAVLSGSAAFAVLSGSAAFAAGRDSDVMVLRNGDLHVGRVAQESFSMQTPYGVIDVPLSHIARLILPSNKAGNSTLITVHEERITGELSQTELFIMRGVLGASLSVEVADMARLAFAPFPIGPKLDGGSDVVVLKNGDRLRGQVITGDYMIKGETGLRLLARGRIRFLDLDLGEDDVSVIAQATLRSEAGLEIGSLLNPSVVFHTQYGAILTLKMDQISSLAFDALSADAYDGVRVSRGLARGTEARTALRDELTDESPGPIMAVLDPKPFRQGDLQGNGDGDERPAHAVTLRRPFAIGIYPVTFTEYDRFCTATACKPPADEGWGRGNRPAINVSWKDAVAYAKWLSDETGQIYRLPSDAEWEFAARAGTGTRYWWGNDNPPGRANCSNCGSLWDGEKTAPVGRFRPNPFGLYDMAGNVWEWAADCYHDTLADAPTDGGIRDKPGCGKRVIRGGAWSFPPKEMRAANRWRDFPSRHSDDTGFRLLREIEAPR